MSEALNYPQWRERFREAIVELDPQRLSVKVQVAERAIRDRLHELVNESYDFSERQALIDALATIAILKRELGDDVPSALTIVC
jgi:hypothetical protein